MMHFSECAMSFQQITIQHGSKLHSAGASGGPAPLPLNKIWPPARGLASHNKRFTIEEIIKIVATRCQILRLKCTKSFVCRSTAPDPAGGAYSAPPDRLAGF